MNNKDRDEREDLTPGTGDPRFGPVDPDFDYEGQTNEWDGEPGEATATLDAIRQDSLTEADAENPLEARLESHDPERYPKRYTFTEPDSREAVEIIVNSLLNANHYALVAQVVSKPGMSRQSWDNEHTEYERERLWGLCCDFLRAEELVDPRLIQQAERNRRDEA